MSIHEQVGADIEGFGGLLRCTSCSREVEFYPGAHGHYLANGWPRCCGYTMSWITQRLLDAEGRP